jgi:hypothetical protein
MQSIPALGRQRQLIQLSPRFSPARPVPFQQGDKPLAVRRLDEVQHLVHDNVFEQVPRLLHKFRIEGTSKNAIRSRSILMHP